jgi:hypothetical protein
LFAYFDAVIDRKFGIDKARCIYVETVQVAVIAANKSTVATVALSGYGGTAVPRIPPGLGELVRQ